MTKKDALFWCTECGHESAKWMGQCPGCGAWNSFSENVPGGSTKKAGRGATVRRQPVQPIPVSEAAATMEPRRATCLPGLDRVLGGGLVPGSLVLLAGEPGVGKSTLLLQMAAAMAGEGETAVYVSGEESARQVALRAQRIGGISDRLLLLPETSVAAVVQHLENEPPAVAVIDSIQTMVAEERDSVAGSPTQVRAAAAHLQRLAKERGVPVILVGHVTKDGLIAGPKVLEHLVDVVLSLEGEPGHEVRVLRAAKNRFGTVAEMALYAMTGTGLEAVTNPSAWLLEDRQSGSPGSVVAVALEGTAPVLVEVQALVSPSALGTPRRVAHGLDGSRLALILAVLERHTGLVFSDRDVYLNLVGGLSVREPGLDLAVAAALVSSLIDRPLPAGLAACGEIGLLGEVRAVSRAADRVREAAALGFERVALAKRDATGRLALPTDAVADVRDIPRLLEAAEIPHRG
jgi:DNA repair protein RadA/Sms